MTQAFVPPELVRDIVERYAAEGYTPAAGDRVPAELAAGAAPDFVFVRGDQIILVELRRSAAFVPSGSSRQLSQLARAVRKYPNIRLDVVNVPDPMDVLPDRDVVGSRADAAAAIADNQRSIRDLEAALLLAASATEGALIRLLRDRGVLLGADPGLADLAATAWSEGFMTQEQWERLQRAIDRRNAIAHGLMPGAAPARADVETLVELAHMFANPSFQSALDLVDWFFDRYKDPADGVPFNSREGGYLYVNGGPFDARDVLAEAFEKVPEEIVDLAVEQIEAYGADWVRIADY